MEGTKKKKQWLNKAEVEKDFYFFEFVSSTSHYQMSPRKKKKQVTHFFLSFHFSSSSLPLSVSSSFFFHFSIPAHEGFGVEPEC